MGRFAPPSGSNIKRNVATRPKERNVARGGVRANRKPKESSFESVQTEVITLSPEKRREYLCERDASRAVHYRESLLLQLNAVVLHWPGETMSRRESKQTTDAVRILANLSKQIGEAGIKCIEKIVAWVLAVSDSSGPKPFLWNGTDYLIKMFTDLDFVSKQLGDRAWSLGNFCPGNPLLLSAEEMAGRGHKGKAHAARVRAASMVLLDVLNRNGGVPQTSHLEVSIPEIAPKPTSKQQTRASIGNTTPRMNSRQEPKRKKPISRPKVIPRTEAQKAEEVKKRLAAKKAEEIRRLDEADRKAEETRKKSATRKRDELRKRSDAIKAHELKKHAEKFPPKPIAALSPKIDKDNSLPVCGESKVGESQKLEPGNSPLVPKDALNRDIKLKERISVHESKESFEEVNDIKSKESISVHESKESFEEVNDIKSKESISVHESKESFEEVNDIKDSIESEEEDDYEEDDYEDEYEEDIEDDAVTVEEAPLEPQEWRQLRVLGEGNYGTVYEVIRGGIKAAMKHFKQDDEDDEETAEYALRTQHREIELAQLLVHGNIVKLLDFSESPKPYLVFELMPMNLLELIQQHENGLSSIIVKLIFGQLCSALSYCHHMSVVHRDLKPENILVSTSENQINLKLCDFGAARRLDVYTAASQNQLDDLDDLTNYVGSRWYRAPESLANRTAYRFEIDIWGAACIIAEVATGQNLFSGDEESEVLASIMSLIGAPPQAEADILAEHEMPPPPVSSKRSFVSPIDHTTGLGPKGISLISSMLQWDPKRRPIMKDCLKHAYFIDSNITPSSPMAASVSSTETASHRVQEEEEYVESLGEEMEVESTCIADQSPDIPSHDDIIASHIDEYFEDSDIGRLLKTVTSGGDMELGEFMSLLESKENGGSILRWLLALKDHCGGDERRTLNVPLSRLGRRLNKILNSKLEPSIEWCEAWILTQRRSDAAVLRLLGEAFKKSEVAPKSPRSATTVQVTIDTTVKILDSLSKSFHVDWSVVENIALNRLIGMLSSVLLDEESPASQKLASLTALEHALFGMQLVCFEGLLSAGSKALLLRMSIFNDSKKSNRLNVITDRGNALNNTISCLQNAHPSSQFAPSGKPALIELCPYYKSDYGKKIVDGFAVEEGEGLGPRKELFALIAEQFQSEWSQCGEALVSFQSDMATITITSAAIDGDSISLYDVGSRLTGYRFTFTESAVKEEHRVVMGQKSGSQLRIDRPMSFEGHDSKVTISKKTTPVFSYRQSGECVWLNAKMIRGPRTEELVFYAGFLLGLTIVNSCHMPMAIPCVFFRAIHDRRWSPSLTDLYELDPSYEATITNVRKMSESEFRDLTEDLALKSGGLDERKESYISTLLDDFFEPAVSWQLGLIRQGFNIALPQVSSDPSDLRRMICGEMDGNENDFDFRKVFRIKMDPDFASCEELKDTFWEVIDHLPLESKRKFLLFVTGVKQLPSPGSELLSIDIPFYPMGLDDHRKVLGMIPQSHTCDNVFELPNYWASLVKIDQGVSSHESLKLKLRSLIFDKITVACDNAAGYGLDGLDDDSDTSSPRALPQGEADFEEESFGESSGHMSIPAMEEEMVEQVASPPKERVNEVKVSPPPKEVGDGDDYEDDDYEDEFDFEEESVEL